MYLSVETLATYTRSLRIQVSSSYQNYQNEESVYTCMWHDTCSLSLNKNEYIHIFHMLYCVLVRWGIFFHDKFSTINHQAEINLNSNEDNKALYTYSD